jgi:ubiquinol-cytochrome c reductase cytochrome c subunit
MMKTRLVIAVVCTAALGGAALDGTILTAQSQAQPTPAGSVDKGRLGFVRVGCAQCHGREAQGSPTTGPRLGPNGLPYTAFARYVRAPRLQMPPYTEKILPDADLADLYAFVQSRPKSAAPPALLSSQPAKPN